MKRILLSLFIALPLTAMEMTIPSSFISNPARLGEISVVRDDAGFSVLHNNERRSVKRHDVDPVLKSLGMKQLALALKTNRIQVKQLSNEDYTLALQGGLKGGGPGGAGIGVWIGKGVVHIIGHGAIAIAAAAAGTVGGPVAAASTGMFLEANCAAAIEAASMAGAVAGGLIGAVITGPA